MSDCKQIFLDLFRKHVSDLKDLNIDEDKLIVHLGSSKSDQELELIASSITETLNSSESQSKFIALKENKSSSAVFSIFEEKNKYLKYLRDSERASVNDHRSIGYQLDIFDFDALIGAGMPVWLQNGITLKKTISSYINYIQEKNGITMVSTPELGRKELYKTSGHWDHYRENMFPVLSLDENDEYILRPMTCPHHILLFKKQRWHEKQLPIAYGENARLYRYECSGGLFGLERTRCMELIDTHLFTSKNKLRETLEKALNIVFKVKEAFNIEHHEIVLSIRDENKEKFFKDDRLWENAERCLREFLDSNGIKYVEGKGDAAFYGPKIDFQIKTFAGKIITISTIQLDFLLPQKFELSYINSEEKKETPIMVHLGIIGTLERFIAYLLERDKGWLPFWLSPVQISIIPIDPDKHLNSSIKLSNLYKKMGLRVEIMDEKVSLKKRIAQVIQRRIYGYIVIGDNEVKEISEIRDDLDRNSLQSWEKYMSKVSKSKNKELNLKISGERYPEDSFDFLRWAALNS